MTEAPIPPESHECCDSGCNPCVWDIYREALRQWQEKQRGKTEAENKAEGYSSSKMPPCKIAASVSCS